MIEPIPIYLLTTSGLLKLWEIRFGVDRQNSMCPRTFGDEILIDIKLKESAYCI